MSAGRENDDRLPAPRIGVLGGTFDPIHFGHLRIGEAAREQFRLDRVLLVPNRDPIHKDHEPAPADERFAMLVLATQDHPSFEVSRIELERETPSYAIDTLRHLRDDWPDADLFFIVGADEIVTLPSWRESSLLLELAQFIAAPRPGYDMSRLPERLPLEGTDRIHVLGMAPASISSSDLRERVAGGRSIRYETPESVVRYIEKRGLYRARL